MEKIKERIATIGPSPQIPSILRAYKGQSLILRAGTTQHYVSTILPFLNFWFWWELRHFSSASNFALLLLYGRKAGSFHFLSHLWIIMISMCLHCGSRENTSSASCCVAIISKHDGLLWTGHSVTCWFIILCIASIWPISFSQLLVYIGKLLKQFDAPHFCKLVFFAVLWNEI